MPETIILIMAELKEALLKIYGARLVRDKQLVMNNTKLTFIVALSFLALCHFFIFTTTAFAQVNVSNYYVSGGKMFIDPGIVYFAGYYPDPLTGVTVTFSGPSGYYSVPAHCPHGYAGAYSGSLGPVAPGENYYIYASWGGGAGPFTVGYPDSEPPQISSYSVRCSGATNTLTVMLDLEASDTVGVTAYYAIESLTPPAAPSATASGWTSVAPSTNYSGSHPFTASKNSGSKTVYVWFKDAANNVSARASKTFTITDSASPLGSFMISQPAGSVSGYFNSPAINMTLTSNDTVSDVTHYLIRSKDSDDDSDNTPSAYDSSWVSFATPHQTSYSGVSATHTLTGADGSKKIFVWYKDAAGNIGLASNSSQTIYLDTKVPKGTGTELSIVSTIASGLAVQNVAADANGNVFVVGGGAIKKISTSGSITTITSSLDVHISGLALDKVNNLLYTCGHTSHTPIRKITTSGVITVLNANPWGYSDGPLPSATFRIPYGCAVDDSGNLYLGDSWNNRVRKITPSGMVSTYAGVGVYGPTYNNTNQGAFADGNRLTQAMFFSPGFVTVDKNYNVFVSDSYNHRIRKVDYATGYVSTYAGNGSSGFTDAASGANATFTYPGSLTVDRFGNVFVLSCTYSDTVCAVRKIAPDTSVSTYAGAATPGTQDGPALLARFGSLSGITSDDEGNVYVADSGNNSVRKISTPIAPPELIINDGAKLTTVRNLKLKIFGTDKHDGVQGSGIEKYCIKYNDSVAPAADDGVWLNMPAAFSNNTPTTQEIDFTLPPNEPDGLKIFYLWFKDKAGNVSPAAQKSIKYDTHPPVEPIAGNIAIAGPHPELSITREVMLQLNAESGQDTIENEGYYDIQVSHYFLTDCNLGTPVSPPDATSAWIAIDTPVTPYSETVNYTLTSAGDGTKEIYVWYKDVVGNMSLSSKCETFLDTSVPHGSFTINSGAEWSNSPLVTLNLSALSVTAVNGYFISMRSTAPAATDAGWHPVSSPVSNYTANVPYSLDRSSGVKTVYVWYKSTSGIVSEVSSASIKLDCEPPTAGVVIQDKWLYIGNEKFTPSSANHISLFVYEDTIYITFVDFSQGSKLSVMKFNGTDWEYVGAPGITSNYASNKNSMFVYEGTPYIVYTDFDVSNKATVKKFNGTNWINVGTQGFSNAAISDPTIYVNKGTPYIAFEDHWGNPYGASVMKFNGTNWVYVGTPKFHANARNVSLAFHNDEPCIAFADRLESPYGATVMKFNGTNWEYIGNQRFSSGDAEQIYLLFNNGVPFVAFSDMSVPGDLFRTSVMKFNGGAWEFVGNRRFSHSAQFLSFYIHDDKPFVLFMDSTCGYKASLMSFSGGEWKYVGQPGFSSASVSHLSLAFHKGAPIAAFGGGKASVMKYEIKRGPGLDINNGAQFAYTPAVKLNLAATDDYSGITEYYAAESPEPPNGSTAWVPITMPACGTTEVNFNLSTVMAPVTVYVWFRDAAGNISSYSKKKINPRLMRAEAVIGGTYAFNKPFLIARDSDENLIIADNPAAGMSPVSMLTKPLYSYGARLLSPGTYYDQLANQVAGLVVFADNRIGLIETVKKRFAIFDILSGFIGGFAKSVDMLSNYHGYGGISDTRLHLIDKYDITGAINPYAETAVMTNQSGSLPLDLNFAPARLEVFTDAACSTPAGEKISLPATLHLRVSGAGGDPNTLNSIIVKAHSGSDPKGVAIQLIETGGSSDTFTGALDLGVYTNRNLGTLGVSGGDLITIKIHSKNGILSKTLTTEKKSNEKSGPTLIVDLGGGIAIEMVRIPAGTFVMGQVGIVDATPTHEVTISKDFYMSKYEVTQGQWLKVMGVLASANKPLVSQSYTYNYGKGENYPVYLVSWDDICNSGGNDFMARLNAMGLVEGTFRLPTEAEWEYACRAGTTSTYYWGEDASEATMKKYCWYNKNASSAWTDPHADFQGTQIVGQKLPNAFGLYDMSGNVYEWCNDWYGAYTSAAVTDPAGPATGSPRVLRGGSWYVGSDFCRSAYRGYRGRSFRSNFIGFRLALSPGQ